MSASVTVRHNFETGHRLPILGGKCQNLHGHSWWAEITVTAPGQPMTVVEFGAFKAKVREWIDTHLDHGLCLGKDDPLATILPEYGKVYRMGEDSPSEGLDWPTVENVAVLLARVGQDCLDEVPRAKDARVTSVQVSETHVNRAGWSE